MKVRGSENKESPTLLVGEKTRAASMTQIWQLAVNITNTLILADSAIRF